MNALCGTEITNFSIIIFSEEDIKCFNVTMQNTFLSMKVLNAKAHLNEDLPDKVIMKLILLLVWISCYLLSHVSLEVTIRTILQDNVYAKISVNE